MNTADFDIVYFVKDAPHNEELRYSIRSVVQNFPHRAIWIVGFCPYELNADGILGVEQKFGSKWANTKELMRRACECDAITEDFWLFNDDFFVMKPVDKPPALYDGTLEQHIADIEARHGHRATTYTTELEKLVKTLKRANLGTLNYAIHKPMLINRAKMLETMRQFPNQKMLRALYGNHHAIGGEPTKDIKMAGKLRPNIDGETFVSTDDYAFTMTDAGEWIRAQFPNRCKYEVD